MHMFIYTYMHIYIYIHVSIYIYISIYISLYILYMQRCLCVRLLQAIVSWECTARTRATGHIYIHIDV